MANPAPSAPAPLVGSPFDRWAHRQQTHGGSALELSAAHQLMAELRCVDALAETLVSGGFSREQRYRLRDKLFEAKAMVAAESALEVASEPPPNPTVVTTFGTWLLEQTAGRAQMDPTAAQFFAVHAAAARMVYESFVCAKAIVETNLLPARAEQPATATSRAVLARPAEVLTVSAVLDVLEMLIEHEERIQGSVPPEADPE